MCKLNSVFLLPAALLLAAGYLTAAPKTPQGAMPTSSPDPSATTAAPARPDAQPIDAPAAPTDAPPEIPEAPKPTALQQQDLAMAQIALGERFAQMARDRLRSPVLSGAMWEESRALLKAAVKLSPKDPRYSRLLIEVMLKMQDVDGAVKALNDYRALVPDDRVAQIQLIDLYVSQMEAADKKLTYLKGLVNRATIPPEVRSHCAVAAVDLLMERSAEEANDMLEKALELFPNSPEALRKRYQMLPQSATPVDQGGVLLAMLRSNCNQPWVMNELATLLASEGLAKQAMDWYGNAFTLYPRSRMSFPNSFVANYATQTLLAGQEDAAFALLTSYLKARPDDVEAWFVRLSIERPRVDQVDASLMTGAESALAHRWGRLSDRLLPPTTDASRPAAPAPKSAAGVGLPKDAAAAAESTGPALDSIDPASVVAKSVEAGNEEWKPSVAATVEDIAWFDLYFAGDANGAAKWVDALGKLLPADAVELNRLRGWLDLVRGNKAEATALLSPLAGKDPLAALGVIRLTDPGVSPSTKPATAPATSPALKPEAPAAKSATMPAGNAPRTTQPVAGGDVANPLVKLLAAHRSGTLGALLWGEVKSKGLRAPAPIDNTPLSILVQRFPKDLLKVLDTPGALYTLKLEPVKLAHKYGEPMFVKVSVRNLSSFDLTLGTDGLIHPDLWFTMEFTGMDNRVFSGVTFDRIARAVVLHPGEETGQYVRVDQGPVAEVLSMNPSGSYSLHCTVLTNPISSGEAVGPGPAGLRSGAALLARSPFPLASEAMRKKVLDTLTAGNPQEKIAALEMMTTYIRIIAAQKQTDPAFQSLAAQFYTAMGNARSDQPIVAGIGNYLLGSIGNAEQRQQAVDLMSVDSNWEVRLLAMRAAEGLLAPDKRSEMATSFGTNDVEPIIKEYAPAMLELAKHPPTTQPERHSGDAPTTTPAGTTIDATSLPEDAPPLPESNGSDPLGVQQPGSAAPPVRSVPNVNKSAPKAKRP